MKAKNTFEIFNLYEVMPGHGESLVKVTNSRNELIIEVIYDSEQNGTDSLVFHFENCVAYEVVSFPGVSVYNTENNSQQHLGSLIEYKNSDYAALWNSHFLFVENRIKHFAILFLHENQKVNIFCESVTFKEKHCLNL